MANKQTVNINFQSGVDTKTDPWQLPIGAFSRLKNSIFNKGGQLKKRNGYQRLTSLPEGSYSYVTTYNQALTALGPNVATYSAATEEWTGKGHITPLALSTLSAVRNSLNQVQCDSAVGSSGLVCVVYSETSNVSTAYYYTIIDTETNASLVSPTLIPAGSGVVTGSPRVFALGNYFVIVFTNVISAASHLQYISVSMRDPTIVTTAADIAASYVSSTTLSWDGVVFNNNLYLAYNTTSGGQAVKITYLPLTEASIGGSPVTAVTYSGKTATLMSLCVDDTVPTALVYVSFYNSGSSLGYTLALDAALNEVLAPVNIIAAGTILNLTSAAQDGVCTLFQEVSNFYSYDSAIPSYYVRARTVTSAGVLGTQYNVIRSVGLGSKAFIHDGTIYFLGAFQSPYQPSYFLIDASLSAETTPIIVAKLAYSNGGGYLSLGLPSATVDGDVVSFAYLYKDLVQALTTNNNTQQTTTGGIYAQTGVNIAFINFTNAKTDASDIAKGLHFSGGFLGFFDGYKPVEHGFFVWPDSVEVSTNASAVVWTGNTTNGSGTITNMSSMVGVAVGASITGSGIPAAQKITAIDRANSTIYFGPSVASATATGVSLTITGNISTAQQYYYQVVYEWSDYQGNIHRSAPSIPVAVTTTGTTSTNKISFPRLRLTMKTENLPKITVFRWSAAQQVYHQITSVSAPILNDTGSDDYSIWDCYSDSDISGNSIIYTTGGVLENISAPATNIMALFDTRLWVVDAENPDVLWYSKQVFQTTPVEMSDLQTLYATPNTGTTVSTGPITAIAPMDDKLIIFKENAIYYINGAGPDATGANNQYSQPTFITSSVGCNQQSSVALMPEGLVFRSSKGTWLLGRGLNTTYIGAPVENFNESTVNSANSIPKVNEVRQTLSSGETLLFDYYYNQWGTFENVPAISSTIYEDQHTYINKYGEVFKEKPGFYQDGSTPTVMGFTTGWINLAALQGFERLHSIYLLGRYYSPHKLLVQISYNYIDSVAQSVTINPVNYSPAAASPFGDQPSPFGSPVDLEQWRIDAKIQKCQSFKISIDEIYDPSLGAAPGAGLTLSGINLQILVKRATRPIRASNSVGLR